MLMLVDYLMFLGFVMTTEVENNSGKVDYVPTTIAGVFFVIQFSIFVYSFNFNGIPILTWIGWLLLIPGFLLISLSKSALKNQATIEERKDWLYVSVSLKLRGNTLIRHPLLVGWFMMSVALAMISQNWLGIFCMEIQLPLIVFTNYSEMIPNA